MQWSIPTNTYPGNQSMGANGTREYLVPEPVLSLALYTVLEYE